MIKIDFKQFVRDRMWFGWQWSAYARVDSEGFYPPTAGWVYSPYWVDRLWPVNNYNGLYPKWWYSLLGWQKL